jgi:hypothetical protein
MTVAIIDARSGKLVRSLSAGALHLPGNTSTAILAYAQGKLVVATPAVVAAVDPNTGRRLWQTPGGATALTVAGDTIFTGKGCQYACGGTMASSALSLGSGHVLWQHKGNGGETPVLIDGRVYQTWPISDNKGETRVYDPLTGQEAGTLPWSAFWTGDSTHVYADVLSTSTSQNGRTWAGQIGPTGKPAWKTNTGKAGAVPPVLAYHTLFVASNRFHPGVLALNAGNGHVLWAADLGRNLRLMVANHLLFALNAATGRLTILRAATGQAVGQFHVPGYVAGTTAGIFISGGTLYVADGKGLIAMRS